MATPSEVLAEKILTQLVEEKLLITEDAQKKKAKLSTGKLKAEDWQLAIEKALNKEKEK